MLNKILQNKHTKVSVIWSVIEFCIMSVKSVYKMATQ